MLTLSMGKGISSSDWFADASFSVHCDFESHNGMAMRFGNGRGCSMSGSDKQKLNTESLTMAESVGVDCVLPLVLWVPLFLKEQGHKVTENKMHQDNESATLSAKNGKVSSGERTRAVNIGCFCIEDQINRGNVSMDCCHTDNVTSNHMSERLQGLKF